MLSLERALTIDGISVFRDHADPNQFWCLPGPVALARRPGSNQPALSFIKFKDAVGGAGLRSGGFAMIETTLEMPESRRSRILGALAAEPGVTSPVLATVPFESGTVQCIALNLQGAGGTGAGTPPAGAFNAVEEILGATTPSLDAQNRAAFSLVLSKQGATILAQAFADGLAPIGVIYSLDYTAMRPAIDVEIIADYERIFQQFQASIEGQYMFFRAGIDAAFEKLVQTGAIKIKVFNFTGEDDEKEKEKWALDFFKSDLIADWFKPTLTPGKVAGQEVQADPLSEVLNFGRDMLGQGGSGAQGGGTATAPRVTASNGPTPANSGSTAPAVPPAPSGGGGAGTTAAPATPAARPAAVLAPDPGNAPLGPGRSVVHVPAATGTTETLRIAGAGARITVNEALVPAGPGGVVQVDLPPGASKAISVTWQTAAQPGETFLLFFDFDEPAAAGWSAVPPSAGYRAYVADNNPADTRYLDSSGVSDGTQQGGARAWPGAERGAARLTAWLNALPQPRAVTIDAHASFEHAPQDGSGTTILPEPQRREHNMRLSMRRGDVAEGIVGSAGGVALSRARQNHGDAEARGDPANPATGDPADRVVRITARGTDATTATYRATLSRGAAPAVPPPAAPPVTPPPVTPPPRTGQPASSPSTTGAAVSLKLRFIRQDEKKVVTLRYNRAEAVKRVFAPQGFVGLMLAGLDNAAQFMTEVDLDDPFFRDFAIIAEAPGDFARIGMTSAQAAIDYGRPDDQVGVKHVDLVFRPGDQGPKTHDFTLSEKRDLEYRIVRQFHFDPASGWDAPEHAYEIPETSTADRTLLLNPADLLDFLEIAIEPGDIDFGIVERIETTVRMEGPADFVRDATFIVRQGEALQTWRVRAPRAPDPRDPRRLSHVLRHHLEDGTVREDPPVTDRSGRIIVHDPFPTALEVTLMPLFGDSIAEAFAEIHYEDAANGYTRVEQVKARGDSTEGLVVRIALLDPRKRDFQAKFTFVGKDGSFVDGPMFRPEGSVVAWRP